MVSALLCSMKFEVGALFTKPDPKPGAEFEIGADTRREQVVTKLRLAERIVEVAAPDHGFDIGNQRPIGAKVATADRIGPFVALVAIGAVDLVEFALDADMRPKVEVGIGGEAGERLLNVVGSGYAVAGAYLDVCRTRGGGKGLGIKCGCAPEQER